MTALVPVPVTSYNYNESTHIINSYSYLNPRKPCCFSSRSSKLGTLQQNRCKLWAITGKKSWVALWGDNKDAIFNRVELWTSKKRVGLARFSQGFGFNGGDGGGGRGGGRGDGTTARVLGNLALAVGLTYLSMTGQLGWIFDAVGWVLDTLISLWLLAVVIPIIGLGAFLWWVGRDMIQGTCPNCGNEFQVFKSTLNDEVQLCPFCTQPFSVAGDEFVKEPVKFSNASSPFGQSFNDFVPKSGKGKVSSSAVVDIEAEIKDAD